MSNEEKILSMLTKMQSDIDALRSEVATLKVNSHSQPQEEPKKKMTQYEAFMAMANLLDDDEKDALGKYMEEEMARKAALYG